MLGLASLHSDGNVEGGRLVIDSGGQLSACQPSNAQEIRRVRLQRQGPSIDVNFQVADVHRLIIAVRGLTATGCEVEFYQKGA